MKHWVPGITACLLLAAAVMAVQKFQIHPRMNKALDEDLLYLPNEKLIVHFTGGLSGVIADLLWIRTISYAAAEFSSTEKKFTWLEQLIRTVTKLDPYYEDAYASGGMMLSALGQDDPSIAVLHDGLVALPHSEKIPLELATVYLLNRRKEPEAPAATLHYLNILAKNSDHPDFYLEWMDRIRRTNSLEGEARRVWADLAESTNDDFVRELALAQLAALDAEALVQTLTDAAKDFQTQQGRAPHSLDEILGVLGEDVPNLADVQGRTYLAPDGTVRNSLLDSRVAEAYQRSLRSSIDTYKNQNEKFPESLETLKAADPAARVEHPVPGFRWNYDPATGEVVEAPVDNG